MLVSLKMLMKFDLKRFGNKIIFFTITFLSITFILLLFLWFNASPSQSIAVRVSGDDEKIIDNIEIAANIEGKFKKNDGVPSAIKSSWPRFRGGEFDNISKESISLLNKLPADQSGNIPPVIWSIDLGEGYAGPAVKDGCVYILDYDEKNQSDTLRCLSLNDGREIWRRWYKVAIKRNHGMSRTVPAVKANYVVTIGPKCHVLCADSINGEFRWGIDLVNEYGTEVPLWYTGQCPVIDNAEAVIAPGGKALMIGIGCANGRVKWEVPNPGNWQMSHSSIISMKIHGKKMFVYCAKGGMAGISAEIQDRGRLLWKTEKWNHSVIAPSPVQIGNNRIFVTAGYGSGSMMLIVNKDVQNGQFSIEVDYIIKKEVFACEQQTPIYYNGYLYSILPNDAGEFRRQAACLDPVSGKLKWVSGKTERFGLGPFMIADNKMFILDDTGNLTMIRVSENEYIKLGKIKVLNGRDSWGPMALVEGRLLIRDSKKLICLDLRIRKEV